MVCSATRLGNEPTTYQSHLTLYRRPKDCGLNQKNRSTLLLLQWFTMKNKTTKNYALLGSGLRVTSSDNPERTRDYLKITEKVKQKSAAQQVPRHTENKKCLQSKAETQRIKYMDAHRYQLPFFHLNLI